MYVGSRCFTASEIRGMERTILNALKFQVLPSSRSYVSKQQNSQTQLDGCWRIVELSLVLWQVSVPTVFPFLGRFCKAAQLSGANAKLPSYIAEVRVHAMLGATIFTILM